VVVVAEHPERVPLLEQGALERRDRRLLLQHDGRDLILHVRLKRAKGLKDHAWDVDPGALVEHGPDHLAKFRERFFFFFFFFGFGFCWFFFVFFFFFFFFFRSPCADWGEEWGKKK
jgi:hypothetical protein